LMQPRKADESNRPLILRRKKFLKKIKHLRLHDVRIACFHIAIHNQ
jgi:hypothetical protein